MTGPYEPGQLFTCDKPYASRVTLCRYEKLNAPIQTNFTLAYVKAVQDRFLSLSGVIEIQDFLRGWFNGADPTTIREGNLEDFVAYGFYTRTMEALDSKASLATCL